MKRSHRLLVDPINDAFRKTHAEETKKSERAEKALDAACQALEKRVLPKEGR